MALPEAISLRYSEEEAGYVSFRPIVRQTFRLHELLDMVLSVTGKDPARIQQILHAGNVVFHYYHYWWEGFDAGGAELSALLARFPDPDPSRPFSARACTLALLENADAPRHPAVEIPRAAFVRKRLLRRRSFWDALLAEAAAAGPPAYRNYSYAHRADLYELLLAGDSRARLIDAAPLAPRHQQQTLRALDRTARIAFVCPREGAAASAVRQGKGTA